MMRFLFHLSAALLVAAGAWISEVHAQLLPFTHYTTEGESRVLPSAEIKSIHQDRLGYLWITAYSSGLVRYDGTRMELYDEDDGLGSVGVWDVHEDSVGRLWVSTNEGVFASAEPLNAYENGRRATFADEFGTTTLSNTDVRENLVSVDAQGRTWVANDDGLVLRYTPVGQTMTVDTVSVGHGAEDERQAIRSILARADGSVWVGFVGGTIVRFAGEGSSLEIRGRGASENTVSVLYEDAGGILWGGETTGRLWRLEEGRGAARFITVSTDLSHVVNAIMVTGRGHVFAASGGSGVLRVNRDSPRDKTLITRENGLLSDIVNDLIEDAEGNIWIAQPGGLSKLRYNYLAFESYTAQSVAGERPLLPAPAVSSVEPSYGRGNCDLWAGTAAGLSCLERRASVESRYIQAVDGLSRDYVNALALDSAGRLWVGSPAGIDVVAPAGSTLPDATSTRNLRIDGTPYQIGTYGDITPTVLSITASRIARSTTDSSTVEAVWLAANRALFLLAADRWYRMDEPAGLPRAVFHAVARDHQGHVWVGTRDRGLYRSIRPITLQDLRTTDTGGADDDWLGRAVTDPGFASVWSQATGAPTDQIEALQWIGDAMWVATPAGIFLLEGAAEGVRVVSELNRSTGLSPAHVFSFDVSPTTGHVWAGTNAGLVEIDPESAEIIRRVTRRDGLIDNEVWFYGSVRADARGRIHFGTAKGLTVYDPALDRSSETPPAVHLRRADVVASPDGYNEVVFEYAATSFADEGAVQYRTRLAGYESSWSAPTTEGKIRYTNLPAVLFPRTYTIEVAARSKDGTWTPQPLAYTFSVAPRWWLRWWAFGLYAIVLAASGAVAVRAQRARFLKRMRERARLREIEFRADHALAEQAAAEARAQALQAENDRKETELTKARELEVAYNELKTTQAQLVQAEKMASLGQLTAGIAHEIKNPLNFVNNFAKITAELADELLEELAANPERTAAEAKEEIDDLIGMIVRNTKKIEEHGGRADRIVRSMLEHSRGGGGTSQPVDFNTLVGEYVNLAYHGTRASVPGFNVTFDKELSEAVGTVELVPQEFGRVLINILNNAFYALHDYREDGGPEYKPTLRVVTRRTPNGVELHLGDNGPGIPAEVADKVFEPFFTTKPTGEGTGLGLSLSYDIVTQMHGGTLRLETEEGAGTTFIITLPTASAPSAISSGEDLAG